MSERLNIRQFAPIENEHELALDIEREITDEEWERAATALEGYRKEFPVNVIAEMAADMRVLDPSRESPLKEGDWDAMTRQMELLRYDATHTNKRNWGDFAALAKSMRILYPNRTTPISQSDLVDIDDFLANDKFGASELRENFHLLFPNHVAPGESKHLEYLRENFQMYRDGKNMQSYPENYVSFGEDLRIFAPNHRQRIDSRGWDYIRKVLNEVRERVNDPKNTWERDLKWHMFMIRARQIKIFTAHEVKLSEKGIEIQFRPPAGKSVPDQLAIDP